MQFDSRVSLLTHNSLGVPATCEYFCDLQEPSEVADVLTFARQNQLPLFVLGDGTNLVLKEHFPGLVVRNRIAGIGVDRIEKNGDIYLNIGAGENWHSLVKWCLREGYHGLENLALIPGTCGAAPVQNIGAYGVELSDVLTAVEFVDLRSGESKSYGNEQCQFGYRDSYFKGDLKDSVIITGIQIRLSFNTNTRVEYPALGAYLAERGLNSTPANVFSAVCAIRSSKLPEPEEIPNAGSFFKNPIISNSQFQDLRHDWPKIPGYPNTEESTKVPAGWLIETLGWKGKRINGIGMHDSQALVLVNPGHRTGEQILGFAEQVQADVEEVFGIELEIEPRVL